MLYKPDARKLWKVFHFVCFHFPLFRHFFVFFFTFFSTIEIETKFYKKYPAEFRNYVRCQRKSAWKVNNFEMLSWRDPFWWRWKWNYWCRNTENCEILTSLHLFPLRGTRERFIRKFVELLNEWKICFHSWPIQAPDKMMMAPRKLIRRYVRWIRNPAEQEKLANRNK